LEKNIGNDQDTIRVSNQVACSKVFPEAATGWRVSTLECYGIHREACSSAPDSGSRITGEVRIKIKS